MLLVGYRDDVNGDALIFGLNLKILLLSLHSSIYRINIVMTITMSRGDARLIICSYQCLISGV